MATNFVRAPNRPVLVVGGLVFLLLAIVGVQKAVLNPNHYRLPVWMLAEGSVVDAILGLALLYVVLRKSQFAGATAVVIATFLIFGILFEAFVSLAFGLPFRVTWGKVAVMAIATAILLPLIFPWSWSANKPVLFWMALTIGLLTLLMGSLMILARL